MPGLRDNLPRCLLLAWLLCGTVAWGTPLQCCDNEALWNSKKSNCTDGRKSQLVCSNGYFVFDPKEETDESYTVVESNNASWLRMEVLSDNSTYNISPSSYCLTKTTEDYEVALICFPDQDQAPPIWRDFFVGLFSFMSSFFLALTLIVYLILPEMRDIQDKAMMSMTASFMVGFFLTGHQQLKFYYIEEDIACIFIAFAMYYAFMCAFFWLNIISFNVWKCVWLPSFKIKRDVLFIIYCMVGWGMPLCFLAASLLTHHIEGAHLKPGFSEVTCWFDGAQATWAYFHGPVLVLLSMNLIYLALTSYKLWHVYKGLENCKLNVLRFKCWMYVKLAIMMGVTWIFEILSYAVGAQYLLYWIIPDTLNVLQGLFIFILLVISRKKVKKALARRKPCNIPFPKSWAVYADEENCEPPKQEELELSA